MDQENKFIYLKANYNYENRADNPIAMMYNEEVAKEINKVCACLWCGACGSEGSRGNFALYQYKRLNGKVWVNIILWSLSLLPLSSILSGNGHSHGHYCGISLLQIPPSSLFLISLFCNSLLSYFILRFIWNSPQIIVRLTPNESNIC